MPYTGISPYVRTYVWWLLRNRYVWNCNGYLIFFKGICLDREESKIWFFCRKDLFSFIPAQHVLVFWVTFSHKYHDIKVVISLFSILFPTFITEHVKKRNIKNKYREKGAEYSTALYVHEVLSHLKKYVTLYYYYLEI